MGTLPMQTEDECGHLDNRGESHDHFRQTDPPGHDGLRHGVRQPHVAGVRFTFGSDAAAFEERGGSSRPDTRATGVQQPPPRST